MGRRKLEGKKPDIDGAASYIISKFKIMTEKDFKEIMVRIDRLEASIKMMFKEFDIQRRSGMSNCKLGNQLVTKAAVPIYKTVLDRIRLSKDGIDFKTLYRMTGFDEKTLRNTLYRLKVTGKIITERRGVYVVAPKYPELVKAPVDETETEIIETEEGVTG